MIDSTVVIAVADREAKKLIVSVARILFHLESTLPMRRSCQFVDGWKEKSRERERERIIYIYIRSVTIIVPLVRRIARISRALLHPLYTRENSVAFSADTNTQVPSSRFLRFELVNARLSSFFSLSPSPLLPFVDPYIAATGIKTNFSLVRPELGVKVQGSLSPLQTLESVGV